MSVRRHQPMTRGITGTVSTGKYTPSFPPKPRNPVEHEMKNRPFSAVLE